MINKSIFTLCILSISVLTIFAQDNVGIGTTSPDPSAILDLTSTDKGLLIPRVVLLNATNNTNPINNPTTGLLVYNESGTLDTGFYYWDGGEWSLIGSGNETLECVTLEQAYNCNGDGAGRTISANHGAVEINLNTGTNTEALTVNSNNGTSGMPTSSIGTYNSTYGGSLYAENTNVTNPYNAIEGATNSNNQYTSGVAGYYVGTGEGVGVYGSIFNNSTSGITGVLGVNNRTDGGHGIMGQGVNGVVGTTNYLQGYGVYGQNNAAVGSGEGPGVYGIGKTGVYGQTENGEFYGVFGGNLSTGTTYNNIGVAGLGWVGVYGQTDSDGYGVYSDGNLGSSGTKSFIIDHPNDPENKLLKHYCAESPEVLNIYRGNVIIDSNGEAIVELPDYFNEININFSYYLTPIGCAAPNLHIKQEVMDNQFIIGGGIANSKVSWVLYAQRNDKYVQNNPKSIEVEPEKRRKGMYIHPELFDKPEEKAMFKLNKHKLNATEIPNNLNQSSRLINK